MQNITSISGKGKVHKLIRADTYTHAVIGEEYGHPAYGIRAPWCDRNHNINEDASLSFFLKWGKTNQPITCKTCLQAYWPDGRKRVDLELNREENGVKITAKRVGDKVHIKTAIFDKGKLLGSSAIAISMPVADKLRSQLGKIQNRRP